MIDGSLVAEAARDAAESVSTHAEIYNSLSRAEEAFVPLDPAR